jgi:uncharacterized protein (DUF58 family)
VTGGASPKLRAYAVLVAVGLLGGLASGRPEPVALAAPIALVLAVGLARGRPSGPLTVASRLEEPRILEGDDVDLVVELDSPTGFDRLDVVLVVPPGLSITAGGNPAAVRLPPGQRRVLRFTLRAGRWGAYTVGEIVVRAQDAAGLFVVEQRFAPSAGLRVHPRPETLRTLVRPFHTQMATGHQPARVRGAGIEFADLRPFAPGDRARDVNWRRSARRGDLWVNQRHPERNTDVVVFLDAFSAGAVPTAVRVATSLVSAYSGQRDRVGLVSFGGTLGWVEPGSGLRQQYRILDALLTTTVVFSYAWKGITTLPRRTLPPRALILAVSPLEDDRSVAALADLRGRGVDLAVIEVAPEEQTVAGPGEAGQLAARLWHLQRDVLRARFADLGVAVVPWREGRPTQELLEEVGRFRRRGTRRAG